ncbi:MAG: ATP synthase F1 subunit gamma [Bacteroidota bacterium]|nr:ATP synthase F1 subunit gamma [Bacteroidota bacterium]
MAGLRDIRRRIAAIRSTAKITQAMKLVAAAKLRRAQEAVIAARPYAVNLKTLMAHLLERVEEDRLPIWLRQDTGNGVLVVVVSADRGLCGAFNTNVIREAERLITDKFSEWHEAGKVRVMTIGKRAYMYFVKRDYELYGKHIGIVNNPNPAVARDIVEEIVSGYRAGTFDRVEIVYNEFKSVIQQNLKVDTLLPIPTDVDPVIEILKRKRKTAVNYIYEPSEQGVLDVLIPKHLRFRMYHVLLESNAAEQGARMTAMDAATENAHELIETLQLEYNSARQASITKELLEIVSGAEALKEGAGA